MAPAFDDTPSTQFDTGLLEPSSSTGTGFSDDPNDNGNDASRARLSRFALELESDGERGGARPFFFPPDSGGLFGVDVSQFQSEVHWEAIRRDRAVFGVARAVRIGDQIDARFAQNWAELGRQKRASMVEGMPTFFRGAYHFFRPSKDPLRQAQAFVQAIGALEPGDLPPALDVEWDFIDLDHNANDRWLHVEPQKRAEMIRVWLDYVEERLGVTPMIYTAKSFWDHAFKDSPNFGRYPLWLASYGTSIPFSTGPTQLPLGWSRWELWQFTDQGEIGGISGHVDTNMARGDLDALRRVTHVTPGGITGGTTGATIAGTTGGTTGSAIAGTTGSTTGGTTGSTTGGDSGGHTEGVLKLGSKGPPVASLQDELIALGYMTAAQKATGPGQFGPKTQAAVQAFQSDVALAATGIIDGATRQMLTALGAGIHRGAAGSAVQAAQLWLVRTGDLSEARRQTGVGRFGPATEAAIKAFQAKKGIQVTGVLSPATWSALRKAAQG